MSSPSLARPFVVLSLLLLPAFAVRPARADDPKPDAAPEKPAPSPKDEKDKKDDGKEEKKAEKKDEAKDAEKAPPTVAAEKGLFEVTLDLSGAFEPVGAAEAKYEPDAYGGELEVLEAVPAGPVQAGQVLVRVSTEKIDEQIQAVERDVEIAKRALEAQREDAKRAQEATDIAVERAKSEKERADRALKTFLETDRELRTKEADQRLQGTRDSIQDQEEELAQLKKMYGADQVVEETESIVMKRAQRQLDRSKLGLGFQTIRYRYLTEIELPEEEKGLRMNARKEAAELDRLLATAPLGLEKGRLEMAKAEVGFQKQGEALEKLRKDREALTIRAPRAGWAIPGGCVRGRWGGVDETARSLEKGGKLRANAAIYTIVDPGAVSVRTAVGEASVLSVQGGQTAEITPAADPTKTLKARVTRVARVATEGGFEVDLDLVDADGRLMPGFTCKVKLKTAEKTDAITVPAGCVTADGEKKLVHVVGADGKPAPREVKTGATSGGKTEILEGLEAGTRVLKNPPKS